jgi:hypothetical protein
LCLHEQWFLCRLVSRDNKRPSYVEAILYVCRPVFRVASCK